MRVFMNSYRENSFGAFTIQKTYISYYHVSMKLEFKVAMATSNLESKPGLGPT